MKFYKSILSLAIVGMLAACGGGDTTSVDELISTKSRETFNDGTRTEPVIVAAKDASAALVLAPVVPPFYPSNPLPPIPTALQVTGWTPALTDTWNWQLSGTVKTTVDAKVYDIDLFDTPQSTIDALKARGTAVVCYFSAGSSENWRPDFNKFLTADKGRNLDGWAGEKWLDTRSANVRDIMKARLDLAVNKKCDAVEPDNVDGYTNKPGFPLTAATQLDYNRFLATEAHARGLKIALKNDVDQLTALEPSFDFAINEQCWQYNECGGYSVFTSKGKPVFNAEYKSKWKTDPVAREVMCKKARAANMRTLVLPLSLNGSFRYSCD